MSTAAQDEAPLPARERRMRRARRELAGAAVRLFEERGFAETTVEDIAEAADYSASTFFRHFGTKEDAVFYDFPERMRLYEALLEDPPPPDEAWARCRAVLLANAAYWEDADPAFARERTALFHREPALYARYLVHATALESVLARVFAASRGLAAPDLRCGVMAAAAVGAWRAAFPVWLANGGRLDEQVARGLELLAPARDGRHDWTA